MDHARERRVVAGSTDGDLRGVVTTFRFIDRLGVLASRTVVDKDDRDSYLEFEPILCPVISTAVSGQSRAAEQRNPRKGKVLSVEDLRVQVAGDVGTFEWDFVTMAPDGTTTRVAGCDVLAFRGEEILCKNAFRKVAG